MSSRHRSGEGLSRIYCEDGRARTCIHVWHRNVWIRRSAQYSQAYTCISLGIQLTNHVSWHVGAQKQQRQQAAAWESEEDEKSGNGSDDSVEEPRGEVAEESGGGQKLPHLRNRLRARMGKWREFATSSRVLSVISLGYWLAWEKGPPPKCKYENKPGCFGEHFAFTCEAIRKLVEQGALEECLEEDLVCVCALDVHANADKKLRLIVDARPVNKYEVKRTFKCESLAKEGRDVFTGCNYGGSIDISHAYHHIEMHPDSRKYLGIFWEGKFYMWWVLPFGLQSAPWIFCSEVGECVKALRKQGVRMVKYFDDFPFGAISKMTSLWSANLVIRFLLDCGFVVEPAKKCVGYEVPLRRFVALGFIIDLQEQMFFMKPERLSRLLALLEEIWRLRKERLPARKVAALAGHIVSSTLALGGVTRMRTRALYAVVGRLETKQDWRRKVTLSEQAQEEVLFWKDNLGNYDGMPIVEDRLAAQVDLRGACDAGASGFGGWLKFSEYCREDVAQEVNSRVADWCSNKSLQRSVQQKLVQAIDFRGEFTPEQRLKSSTWREGRALLKLLEGAAVILQGCRVRVNIDNSCLVFGLGGVVKGFEQTAYGGSKVPEVQELIVQIFNLCVREKISLLTVWVPRNRNERADYLSKMKDHYDFELNRRIFARLDEMWGPHSIDRFSSGKTVLVQSGRFNSRFWQPEEQGCEGIDAFAQDWSGETNWVHPPYRLVGRVIMHMMRTKARGTVVLPWWEGAAWWPLIHPGELWESFVLGVHHLGSSVVIRDGKRVAGALESGRNTEKELAELPVAELWAIFIDCSL